MSKFIIQPTYRFSTSCHAPIGVVNLSSESTSFVPLDLLNQKMSKVLYGLCANYLSHNYPKTFLVEIAFLNKVLNIQWNSPLILLQKYFYNFLKQLFETCSLIYLKLKTVCQLIAYFFCSSIFYLYSFENKSFYPITFLPIPFVRISIIFAELFYI